MGESEPARVLASGIDSLVLAVDVNWRSQETFKRLAPLKLRAKENHTDEPTVLAVSAGSADWRFVVKAHGAGGYEWLLTCQELAMKVGNWLRPKQRPSVMVEIRSETLWTHGPDAVVSRVVQLGTRWAGMWERSSRAAWTCVSICC